MKVLSPLLSLSACLVIFSQIVNAAVFTGTYDFSAASGDTTSFTYNGATVENVTVGDLIKVGVTSSSSADNSRAKSWSTGASSGSDSFSGAIDLGKYFEFSLTAETGYTVDLTSITFGLGRSGTGPRQWEWRSSTDGYAATIGTYTSLNSGLAAVGGVLTNPDSDSSWAGSILDLSGASYQGLTAITFRLYGYNAESTVGTGGFQGDLSFSGQAVPEPAAALLGAFGLLGLLRRRRSY